MALIVARTDNSGWWACFISNRFPVYIGRISYELYLVHWLVRVFTPLVVLDYSFGTRVTALALCFVLAAAIYHIVEVPIRNGRVFMGNRKLILAFTAGTGAILAASSVFIGTDGLPLRLSPENRAMAERAIDTDATFTNCENRFDKPCIVGDELEHPNWILYGDSHANALASAFGDALRMRGKSGWFVFQSGCLPVMNSGNANCREFNRRVERFISTHTKVRNVAIASTWRQSMESGYTDTAGSLVKGERALDAFRHNLRQTITERTAAGRRMAVWLPVPGAQRAVPDTLARNGMLDRDWDISYSSTEHKNRFKFLMQELSHHPSITLLQPARRICGGTSCDLLFKGRPLYSDDPHPASSQRSFYSTIIANDLARHSSSTEIDFPRWNKNDKGR